MRLAFSYGNNLERFGQIMEKMGAKKLDMGDSSYEFEFVNDYFVRFILWEGDDEFPASAQILFSSNFRTAFETYDLAEIGGLCITAFGITEKTL